LLTSITLYIQIFENFRENASLYRKIVT
jgi:hypothetical protein